MFALTGTPIFNDYDDIISIFHFIGQLPECDPTYFQDNSSRMEKLENANRKYMIRGLKADVLDLPDRFGSSLVHSFHFRIYSPLVPQIHVFPLLSFQSTRSQKE